MFKRKLRTDFMDLGASIGQVIEMADAENLSPAAILDNELQALKLSHEHHGSEAQRWRAIEADARERAMNHETLRDTLYEAVRAIDPITLDSEELGHDLVVGESEASNSRT